MLVFFRVDAICALASAGEKFSERVGFLAQVGIVQISSTQVYVTEISPTEVGFPKINPAQINPPTLCSAKVNSIKA